MSLCLQSLQTAQILERREDLVDFFYALFRAFAEVRGDRVGVGVGGREECRAA